MDYKFLLRCTQEAVAGADALLSVTSGGATVQSSTAISSTDSSTPTDIIFEVTGAPAAAASGASLDLVFSIDNDEYIDTDDNRNILIHEVYFCDKADGTNYKHWDSTNGVWAVTTTFDPTVMGRCYYSAKTADDHGAFYNSNEIIRIESADVTCTFDLDSTSAEDFGLGAESYPASVERP